MRKIEFTISDDKFSTELADGIMEGLREPDSFNASMQQKVSAQSSIVNTETATATARSQETQEENASTAQEIADAVLDVFGGTDNVVTEAFDIGEEWLDNKVDEMYDEYGNLISDLADKVDIDLSGVDFDTVDTVVESIIAPENMVASGMAVLQGYGEEYTQMAVDYVNTQIEALADSIDDGVISQIQKGVDDANKVVDLLKKALDIVDKAPVQNLLNLSMIATVDKQHPSIKENVRKEAASLKQQILTAWQDTKQLAVDEWNHLVQMNSDVTVDSVIATINYVLDIVQPILDVVMEKYTDYSGQEVRYMCNKAFSLVSLYKKISEKARQMKAQADALKEQNEEESEETEETVDVSETTLTEEENAEEQEKKSDKIKAKIKADAQKEKDRVASEVKDYTKGLIKEYTKEDIEKKLLDYLKQQSMLLQNAFYIMTIVDLVKDIKKWCEKSSVSSIEKMNDAIEGINDVINLLEAMGATDDAVGLSIEDLKALGFAIADTATEAAKQTVEDAKQYVNDISNNVTAQVSAATDVAASPSSIIDTGITQAYTQQMANNVLSTNFEEIKETLSCDIVNNGKDDDGVYQISVTLHCLPNALVIKSQLDDEFDGVFKNSGIKTIVTKLTDIWHSGLDGEFTVTGKKDAATRIYKFTVTCDHSSKITDEVAQQYTEVLSTMTDNLKVSTYQLMDAVAAPVKQLIDQLGSRVLNTLSVEQVLSIVDGKVLMFDEVVQCLKKIKPLIQTMKVVVHLMENYQINKAYAASKAETNIGEVAAALAVAANGLKDTIKNDEGLNTYTVRTQELYDWCVQTYTRQPDENNIIRINVAETYLLVAYLTLHGKIADVEGSKFNMLKGTQLICDMATIENGGGVDGSYDGFPDNMMIDPATGDIYYDKEGRSIYASQIMRVISNKSLYSKLISDSNAEDVSVTKEKPVLFSKEAAKTQQVIDLSRINFCPEINLLPDVSIDSVPRAIIEFGDVYTLGNRMDFRWNVKAGDSIDKNTVIAYAGPDGLPVRSMFSKGTVSDKVLFRGYADRHIVIENYELKDEIDYNQDEADDIIERFKDSDVMYTFIMEQLGYSLLPVLMDNTYNTADTNTCSLFPIDRFNEICREYKQLFDDFGEMMKDSGGEGAIKSVDGNPKKMVDVGDTMLANKKILLDEIMRIYDDNLDEVCLRVLDGDDCGCLLQDTVAGYSNMNVDEFDGYHNYYMNLVSKVDLSQDKAFIREYYDLLNKIINRRLQCMSQSKSVLIQDFNDLYKDSINGNEDNGYVKVSANFGSDAAYNDIVDFIKNGFVAKKDGETAGYVANVLASMFLSIMGITGTGEIDTDMGAADLVALEASELKAFWKDIIVEYRNKYEMGTLSQPGVLMNDLTVMVEKFAGSGYMQWPIPMDVTIDDNLYKLYEFQDRIVDEKPSIDDVALDEVPETINEPSCEPSVDMEDNSIVREQCESDITIMDYEYWLVYMANATMFTLLPNYWADGFDIPMTNAYIPLPALYIPVYKPIYVELIHITFVFGVAIRGIFVVPIIIIMNMSQKEINAMTPVMIALEKSRWLFEKIATEAENLIPNLVNGMVNQLYESNASCQLLIDKFSKYAALIRSIPMDNKAGIEKDIMRALFGENFDSRQVITRLEKLGVGPEPL